MNNLVHNYTDVPVEMKLYFDEHLNETPRVLFPLEIFLIVYENFGL